jgi:hypothetical protein
LPEKSTLFCVDLREKLDANHPALAA